MNRSSLALAALLGAATVAREAAADAAPDRPAESVGYANTSFVSINPLTFGDFFEVRYERRLYESRSPLLQRNFVAFAVGVAPGPFLAGVARVELQPASFVMLGIDYLPSVFFIDTTESYRTATSAYAVDIAGLPQSKPSYATSFQSLKLGALVQAPVGPLFLRSASSATYTVAALQGDDVVYYNQFVDLLLPAAGWLFANDTTLTSSITPRLRVGPKSTLFATSYSPHDFLSGESRGPASSVVFRVGPSLAWTLRDEPTSALGRLDLFGSVQWYVHDRFRTGSAIDGAVPSVSVGVRVSGLLWSRPQPQEP